MWQYFGTKQRIAKFYPKPLYPTIIEPFAGAAGYSLRHWKHRVILIDKNPWIIQMWRWLQTRQEKDLLGLPIYDLKAGQRLDSLAWPDKTSLTFIESVIFDGAAHATHFVPPSYQEDRRRNRLIRMVKRMSSDLHKIRHWELVLGEYQSLANMEATWFIDPPYQIGGENYKWGNGKMDYTELAGYCRSRHGQVIVCESHKASWLPFKVIPNAKMNNRFKSTQEALWSNRPTAYDATQERLF